MKKWLPWLLLALIIWWIAENPHAAAAFAHQAGAFLRKAATSASTFLSGTGKG